MNNRVCLNPDIKWHGMPKTMRVDGFRGIRAEEKDGVLTITVSMQPKRMSRKRLIKLMMAHGMSARSANAFAEECKMDGYQHAAVYDFVIEKMHKFIDMMIEKEEQKGATP